MHRYFQIDVDAQSLPVFVKTEDKYFQKIDKFSIPKNGKTEFMSLAGRPILR